MTEDERAIIVEVLCSQALADHLGDVRDAERGLWKLLGVSRPVNVHHDAWQNTKEILEQNGIPLPEYHREEV